MTTESPLQEWHNKIIAAASQKLQRPLTQIERQFIECRQSFIATEAVADFITYEPAEAVEQYLNTL